MTEKTAAGLFRFRVLQGQAKNDLKFFLENCPTGQDVMEIVEVIWKNLLKVESLNGKMEVLGAEGVREYDEQLRNKLTNKKREEIYTSMLEYLLNIVFEYSTVVFEFLAQLLSDVWISHRLEALNIVTGHQKPQYPDRVD